MRLRIQIRRVLYMGVAIACLFLLLQHASIFYIYGANKVIQDARDGVVRVVSFDQQATYMSSGSGFGLGEEGEAVTYIVTNKHVIVDAANQIYIDYVIAYCEENRIPYQTISDAGTAEETPEIQMEQNKEKQGERNDSLLSILIGVGAGAGILIVVMIKYKRIKKDQNNRGSSYRGQQHRMAAGSERHPAVPPPYDSIMQSDVIQPQVIECEQETVIFGVTGYFSGYSIPVKNEVLIGRDSSVCQVIFPVKTAGVSSAHCKVRNKGGQLEITDLGSTYGTYLVNGTRLPVNIPYMLQKGECFYLGAPENMFRAE